MTIIPLPLPRPESDFRLLPPTWCYICGDDTTHRAVPTYDCWRSALPQTPKTARAWAALDACDSLRLSREMSDWQPPHIEAVRQLATDLMDWANLAEQIAARVAP